MCVSTEVDVDLLNKCFELKPYTFLHKVKKKEETPDDNTSVASERFVCLFVCSCVCMFVCFVSVCLCLFVMCLVNGTPFCRFCVLKHYHQISINVLFSVWLKMKLKMKLTKIWQEKKLLISRHPQLVRN